MFKADRHTSTSLRSSTASGLKSSLNKTKLQPFGTHYVTRLSSVNNKLVCSLSRSAVSDCITDGNIRVN